MLLHGETRNNLFYSPNINTATACALRRRIDIAAVVDSFLDGSLRQGL
jgi:hypothetical protein